jgi:hypothetical protein
MSGDRTGRVSPTRQDRRKQSDAVLRDLESHRSSGGRETYAIEENIRFFRAARSPIRFLVWMCGRRRRIDPARIRELSDFDLPEWQELLQRELADISSRSFPGLVEPLVAKLVEVIGARQVEDRITTVASIGCGAMEAEWQVMQRLASHESLRIVGCDSSSTAFASASANLATGGHSLTAIPATGVDGLPPGMYLHQGDAFEFLATQPDAGFEVLFHARRCSARC